MSSTPLVSMQDPESPPLPPLRGASSQSRPLESAPHAHYLCAGCGNLLPSAELVTLINLADPAGPPTRSCTDCVKGLA